MARQAETAEHLVAEAAQRVSAEVATVVQLPHWHFAAEFVQEMFLGGLLAPGVSSGAYDHVVAIPLQQNRAVLSQVVRGECKARGGGSGGGGGVAGISRPTA